MYKKGYFLGLGVILLLLILVGLDFFRGKNSRFFGGVVPPQSEGTEKSHREPEIVDLASLYPDYIIRTGNPGQRKIALTFDDGPDNKYTPQILDILKRYNVKATFFLLGSKALQYSETSRRIVAEGHTVGLHGYNHVKISGLTEAGIRDELRRADDAIYKACKRRSKLFRPAYAAIDPASVVTIGKAGYQIILWSIDSLDWRGISKKAVLSNILPFLKNGSIILQHCAGEPSQNMTGTVQALSELIVEAKKRGFQFVTIPQMINVVRADAGPDAGFHTVAEGDTLYLLAKRFNTTMQNLQKWNPGLNPFNIKVGQRIRVKSPNTAATTSAETYTVQPGDSLAKIAKRYGITLQEIERLNPYLDLRKLSAGQSLNIRHGSGGEEEDSRIWHLVRVDDNLYKISQQYGVPWQEIARVNKIVEPDFLTAGQKLLIPSAERE